MRTTAALTLRAIRRETTEMSKPGRSVLTKQQMQSRVAQLRGALTQAEAELAAWPKMPTTNLGPACPTCGLWQRPCGCVALAESMALTDEMVRGR